MIFRIEEESSKIVPVESSWNPNELKLEKYIMTSAESEEQILRAEIFGEELFPIGKEVVTKDKKRADILAIDRKGNGVIIELKRDKAQLGVETQALQYLAEFSAYKGSDFISHFSETYKNAESLKEKIEGFLGYGEYDLEEINKNSRIILMARSFDRALYSMGEWLANSGIPFRCMEYAPVEIEGKYYLSFSISFNQSSSTLYPLLFQNRSREPQYFWHNIGKNEQGWWDYLIEKNQISASFSNQPGDLGERTLRKYIKGDKIIVYAKEYGAVGWGTIEDPQSYKLISLGDKAEDELEGKHRHRISIIWKAVAKNLEGGLKPKDIREQFDIYHPISTSVRINPKNAERLIEKLNRTFGEVQ